MLIAGCSKQKNVALINRCSLFITNKAPTAIANLILLAALLFLASCTSTGPASEHRGDPLDTYARGNLLFYSEKEAESEAYRTWVFVNEDYMHVSDSRTKDDFLLFNRKEQTIYNVRADDKSIMVIKPRDVLVKPPIEIDYQESAQPSSAIPKVQGRQATHYRYTANGEHCYDSVSLDKDFFPDVVAAMSEFRKVLAGEHAKSLGSMPKDMLDACDMALNVFYPAKHITHGFPLREWDRKGYRRFIVNYQERGRIKLDQLVLPEGYERFSIP